MVEQEHATRKDIFISYTGADRLWAEWIAWQLEEAGYAVVFQSSFPSEQDFVQKMQTTIAEANSILIVLSPDYVDALSITSEWDEALGFDSAGKQKTVIPVLIRELHNQPKSAFSLISSLNLVKLNEYDARKVLLEGVSWITSKSPSSPFHTLNVGQPRFPSTFPLLWNVPYRQNPYFTGREALLTRLAESLRAGNIMSLAQPQAISGLGGIGKTQLALEYAYRYRRDYDAVFWITADSRESLIHGYADIARLLNLPQHTEHHQALTTLAVQQWLQTHLKWLLILDNADNLEIVREFLPSAPSGHIILTTRAQSVGPLAKRLEVDSLNQEKGALFLLRRVGLISPDSTLKEVLPATIDQAQAIVTELGGLPLAVDQAGAYIQETGCSLFDYINLYQARRSILLRSRGSLVSDHPEPVATTWTLAFEMITQSNPTSIDLLQLCAFLAPDDIPLELITSSTSDISPVLKLTVDDPIALDRAIATLLQYSLIRRDSSNKTLSIHRLVQAVLLDSMDEETAHQWAERVVHIVSQDFPSGEFETWAQCDRLLPHALRCANWIEQYHLFFLDVTRLLNRTAYYLSEQGRDREAEQLFHQALQIHQMLGEQHPNAAQSLNNRTTLYQSYGRDTEAEPVMQEALKISQTVLGEQHPNTATSLNNLALLHWSYGRDEEAEPLMRKALKIRRTVLGEQHPDTITSLNNLAGLYRIQGRDEEAASLMQEAFKIYRAVLGEQHPDTATSLNDLARLYQRQGKYKQAEQLYQHALAIREKVLGAEHPTTIATRQNLASLHKRDEHVDEAMTDQKHIEASDM